MRSVAPRGATVQAQIARFGSLGPLIQPKSLMNHLAKLGEVFEWRKAVFVDLTSLREVVRTRLHNHDK